MFPTSLFHFADSEYLTVGMPLSYSVRAVSTCGTAPSDMLPGPLVPFFRRWSRGIEFFENLHERLERLIVEVLSFQLLFYGHQSS